MPRYPKAGTQPDKVLQALLAANGDWVSKQFFIRQLFLTQAGARLFELENEYGWPIEHSDFTDEHGFRSYRLIPRQYKPVGGKLEGYEANQFAAQNSLKAQAAQETPEVRLTKAQSSLMGAVSGDHQAALW